MWVRSIDSLPQPGTRCLMCETVPGKRPRTYIARFVNSDFGFSVDGKQEAVDPHPCLWWTVLPAPPVEVKPEEVQTDGNPALYLVTDISDKGVQVRKFGSNAEATEYARERDRQGARGAIYVPIADYGYDK